MECQVDFLIGFSDYLNNRRQRVVVDGVASQWTLVTSGVPQGSILGPMLFVIFINDIPKVVENGTMSALFADDTKVYRTITSVSDCHQLQQALTNLDVWSSDNNITFNALKRKVLSVNRKKTPISYVYCLGSEQLLKVEEEKDLGVTLSSKLLWDSHVNELASKANKLLGLLKQTCPSLTDTNVRLTLYLSIVKSQLCHATQVWSPFRNRKLSGKIKSVQREPLGGF